MKNLKIILALTPLSENITIRKEFYTPLLYTNFNTNQNYNINYFHVSERLKYLNCEKLFILK
jgi:hypothetical protein